MGGGWGGQGGGTGHGFWHHGLNHVRSKSRPKPEAYASQLGCTLDLNPVEVQGHGVLKVQQQTECRTCPVVAVGKCTKWTFRTKGFSSPLAPPTLSRMVGCIGYQIGYF